MILPPRMSSERVADIVEVSYARSNSNLSELAAYAKRRSANPYPAREGIEEFGVRQGDRIICGAHPWLYARKVDELSVTVDAESGFEQISWVEPNAYRLKDDQSGIEVGRLGRDVSITRQRTGSVSDQLIWDRERGTWKSRIQEA